MTKGSNYSLPVRVDELCQFVCSMPKARITENTNNTSDERTIDRVFFLLFFFPSISTDTPFSQCHFCWSVNCLFNWLSSFRLDSNEISERRKDDFLSLVNYSNISMMMKMCDRMMLMDQIHRNHSTSLSSGRSLTDKRTIAFLSLSLGKCLLEDFLGKQLQV